jgi:hypothetical protein
MATCVDVGAAVGGLTQLSMQLTDFYVRKCRSFRRAQKGMDLLQTSALGLSTIIDLFSKTVQDMSVRGIQLPDDEKIERFVADSSKVVEEQLCDFKEIFRRVRSIKNSSQMSKFRAKLMWIICDEQNLKELLASLEPIKLNISIMTNLLSIQVFMAGLDKARSRSEKAARKQTREM